MLTNLPSPTSSLPGPTAWWFRLILLPLGVTILGFLISKTIQRRSRYNVPVAFSICLILFLCMLVTIFLLLLDLCPTLLLLILVGLPSFLFCLHTLPRFQRRSTLMRYYYYLYSVTNNFLVLMCIGLYWWRLTDKVKVSGGWLRSFSPSDFWEGGPTWFFVRYSTLCIEQLLDNSGVMSVTARALWGVSCWLVAIEWYHDYNLLNTFMLLRYILPLILTIAPQHMHFKMTETIINFHFVDHNSNPDVTQSRVAVTPEHGQMASRIIHNMAGGDSPHPWVTPVTPTGEAPQGVKKKWRSMRPPLDLSAGAVWEALAQQEDDKARLTMIRHLQAALQMLPSHRWMVFTLWYKSVFCYLMYFHWLMVPSLTEGAGGIAWPALVYPNGELDTFGFYVCYYAAWWQLIILLFFGVTGVVSAASDRSYCDWVLFGRRVSIIPKTVRKSLRILHTAQGMEPQLKSVLIAYGGFAEMRDFSAEAKNK